MMDDGEEVFLIYSKLEFVALKDFGAEVRAILDISHFLNQAVLLLDVTETSLKGVVELMLQKLLESDEPQCSVQEAMAAIFKNNSAHLMSRTIQGTTCNTDCGSNFDFDHSWLCSLCNLPTLQKRHVAITRLKHPANFGRTSHEVRLFILVMCPNKEKGTKNALEMGRTFCTILADVDFRQSLLEAQTEAEFKTLILKQAQQLNVEQSETERRLFQDATSLTAHVNDQAQGNSFHFFRGLVEDVKRRKPHYINDFKDAFTSRKTVNKVVSTTLFLYFACLLPAIAFGVLNDHNTGGMIDVKKVIIGQTLGGIFFSLFGGQPLLVLLTTAPLALYIKVIYNISNDYEINFYAMYCCVGMWNSFFLVIYSLFDVSRVMQWSTRSTEEIFALFISITFCVDAFRDLYKNFMENYNSIHCKLPFQNGLDASSINVSRISSIGEFENTTVIAIQSLCRRENTLLFIILMMVTLWLSVSLYNFNKTPYLQASKRELLADYSLPTAVLIASFTGSFFFSGVEVEHFHYSDNNAFTIPPLNKLSWLNILSCMCLGFSLSLLYFIDQNISSAIVNNPCNKLKKGPAYHLDLLVVAILNLFLSAFCLPWMHATLPHSPLHVRGLADVEERVEQGLVYEIIIKVRETRITGLVSHILIGLSVFLLPYPLAYIPTPVLDGLFLYMAVTGLNGNQMYERFTLLFMEQSAYPPTHYIRHVPQRKIHAFTGMQVLQLVIICLFGFAPYYYMKTIFPLIILLLLPTRHKIVPKFIEDKFLQALDGEYQ